MEPQSGMIMYLGPTHPPTHPVLNLTYWVFSLILGGNVNRTYNLYWDTVLMCGVPPPYWPCSESMCGVPTPYWQPFQKTCAVSPPPGIHFFCAVSPPQFSSVPWKLWLCLGFWGKLRIWQVPACMMKPSSTCILECGTPSWASLFYSLSWIVGTKWIAHDMTRINQQPWMSIRFD